MVRDYSFKEYDLNFIQGEHWETHPEKNFYIGFELEVEFPCISVDDMHGIADYVEGAYEEILCCKWDGSLTHGFEFISHPIHVELYENGYMEHVLSKLMSELSKYGGVVGSTTGLHFHVSRKGFSRSGFTRRLLCLMTNFREELMENSGRYDYELEGDECRDRFMYCRLPEFRLANINTNELSITRGHRTALNCANDDTLEFRFFAATLDVKEFLKRVSIVINLVRATNAETVHNISIKTIIPDYDGEEKFSIDLSQVDIDNDKINDTINKFLEECNKIMKEIKIYTIHEFMDSPYMIQRLLDMYDCSPYYNQSVKSVKDIYHVRYYDLSLYDYAAYMVDALNHFRFNNCCNETFTTEECIEKFKSIIEKFKELKKVKVDIWKMIK